MSRTPHPKPRTDAGFRARVSKQPLRYNLGERCCGLCGKDLHKDESGDWVGCQHLEDRTRPRLLEGVL